MCGDIIDRTINNFITCSNSDLSIFKSEFINIKSTSTDIINTRNSRLTISFSKFESCTFGESLISSYQLIEPEPIQLNNNNITNCKHTNIDISDASIISTNIKQGEFSENEITFESTNKACKAFQFDFMNYPINPTNNEIKFNQIKIENANCKSGIGCVISCPLVCDPKFTFLTCNFTNCGGGTSTAIHLLQMRREVEFINCKFIQCKCTDGEGRIFYIFFDDKISNITFYLCYFEDLCSMNHGGIGLYIDSSLSKKTITFIDTEFKNFESENDNGGVICFDDHETTTYSYVLLSQCKFTNIVGKRDGGAIYFDSPQGQLTTENLTFTQLKTNGSGGAFYFKYEKDKMAVSIKSCTFDQVSSDLCGSISAVMCEIDQNELVIDNCTFLNNSADHGSCICFTRESEESTSTIGSVSITNCEFIDNIASSGLTVVFESSTCKNLIITFCTFDRVDGAIAASVTGSVQIFDINFIEVDEFPALSIQQDATSSGEVSVTNCIFDGCKPVGIALIDISVVTKLTFSDIFIMNNVASSWNSSLGSINCNGQISELSIKNVTFSKNSCHTLFGGGVGTVFMGVTSLSISQCKFLDNSAHQDTTKSRPTFDSSSNYYNGDGGAIQLGYLCASNNMDVIFDECEFIGNHAERHGGALSIQTLKEVEIKGCKFENNIANYNFASIEEDGSLRLLWENHFSKKTDGRGGAIYINPAFTYKEGDTQCPSSDDIYMTSVNINGCNFLKNNAFDGYAMYIEGDNTDTKFNITSNTFTDNINESQKYVDFSNEYNHKHMKGSVIASEILNLDKEAIESSGNTFENGEYILKKVQFVDNYGNPIATQYFSKSSEFSLSALFTRTEDFTKTDLFSKSDSFSESAKFSPSAEFPPVPLCLAISEEMNMSITDRCYFEYNECKTSTYVKVIVSTFTDFVNQNSGGAVFISNSGFQINGTYFTRCISYTGGGGAVYIKNDCEPVLNINIINCTFIECKAVYGGGAFIFSKSKENSILIQNSVFLSNTVIRLNSIDNNNIYYGGSALFLHSKSGNISDSSFRFNVGKGGACKIIAQFNDDDKRSKKVMSLEKEDTSMFIFSNCAFDNKKNPPISLITANNEDGKNDVEVKECTFKGEHKKGSNIIGGKEKSNKQPKILLDTCRFDFDIKSVVKVEKVKLDELLFVGSDDSIHTQFKLFEFNWAKCIAIILCMILAAAFFSWRIHKYRNIGNSLNDIADND